MATKLSNDAPLCGPPSRGMRWELFGPRLGRRLGGTRSLREDYFVLQECDPTVTSYLPWYALKYHVNSKDIESIVEAKVRYSDGHSEIHLVRYANADADSGSSSERKALEACAEAQDSTLRVWGEDEIRGNETYLRNCHTILPWARDTHNPSDTDTQTILGIILGDGNPMTLAQVSQRANLAIETIVAVVIRAYLRHRLYLIDFRARKFGRHSQVASSPSK